MANAIKYSTSTQSDAIKKGNFYLGFSNIDYGPTIDTGYYSGIKSLDYVTYLWQDNKITYNVSRTDNELIEFVNLKYGQSFSNISSVAAWSITQSSFVITDQYDNIVTDGLSLNLDASIIYSYPKSGSTWFDTSSNLNNGSLINSPSFDDIGAIKFDGIDDSVTINSSLSYLSTSSTEVYFKVDSFPETPGNIVVGGYDQVDTQNFSSAIVGMIFINNSTKTINSSVITTSQVYRTVTSTTTIGTSSYYHVVLNKDTTNGILELYINGSLESSNTFDTTTYAQWTSVGQYRGSNTIRLSDTLSGSSSFNNKFLNGKINFFRLYNRVLTQSEVRQNYNASKNRFLLNSFIKRSKNDSAFFTTESRRFINEILVNSVVDESSSILLIPISSKVDKLYPMISPNNSDFTFSRNGSATYIGSDRLLNTSINNQPRIDWSTSPIRFNGCLIESSSINFIKSSNNLLNNWTRTNTVLIETDVSKFGLTQSIKVVVGPSYSTGNVNVRQTGILTTTSGTLYTYSAYIKNINAKWALFQLDNDFAFIGVWVNLQTFEFGNNRIGNNANVFDYVSRDIKILDNGWARFSVTLRGLTQSNLIATNWITNTNGTLGPTTVGDSFILSCAQIETGPYASSYIETGASQVTRPRDILTSPNLNFGSNSFTYFCDVEWLNEYETQGSSWTEIYASPLHWYIRRMGTIQIQPIIGSR